jgi:hypothetical protein
MLLTVMSLCTGRFKGGNQNIVIKFIVPFDTAEYDFSMISKRKLLKIC